MKTTSILISLSSLLFAGCATSRTPPATEPAPAERDAMSAGERWKAEFQARTQARADKEAAEKVVVEKRRIDYVASHPELPALFKERILAGSLAIGMSAEAVRASIGAPWNHNRTVSRDTVDEQWVYLRGGGKLIESTSVSAGSWASGSYSSRIYLYFTDSVLRSWQD